MNETRELPRPRVRSRKNVFYCVLSLIMQAVHSVNPSVLSTATIIDPPAIVGTALFDVYKLTFRERTRIHGGAPRVSFKGVVE